MKVKATPAVSFIPFDLTIRIESQNELDMLFSSILFSKGAFIGWGSSGVPSILDELKSQGAKEK